MSEPRRGSVVVLLMPFVFASILYACGEEGTDATPAPTDDDTGSVSPTDDDGTAASTSTPASPTTTSGEPTGTVTFEELRTRGADLVGTEAEVIGRAFFIATCPPPSTDAAQPCVLNLYLTDPDRTGLLYGERREAIPILEGGELVSCEEGPGTTSGCPGWENAARYRLTGTVQFLTVGDRVTSQVVLDVTSKQVE